MVLPVDSGAKPPETKLTRSKSSEHALHAVKKGEDRPQGVSSASSISSASEVGDTSPKSICERFTEALFGVLRYIPVVKWVIPRVVVDDASEISSVSSEKAPSDSEVVSAAPKPPEDQPSDSEVVNAAPIPTRDSPDLTKETLAALDDLIEKPVDGSEKGSVLAKEDTGDTVPTQVLDSQEQETLKQVLSRRLLPHPDAVPHVRVEENSSSDDGSSSSSSKQPSRASSLAATPEPSEVGDAVDASKITLVKLQSNLVDKFYPESEMTSDKEQLTLTFAHMLIKEGNSLDAVLVACEALFTGSTEDGFEEGKELSMANTSLIGVRRRRTGPLTGQAAIDLTAERMINNMRRRNVLTL
ncbi:MAG: hypothetical protein S4CHLAM37_08150 [Chlamydiia bacterium]|nr:hypothetical protein [Chlamydiia bacterium]